MTAFLPQINLVTSLANDHAVDLAGADQAYVLSGVTVAALGSEADGISSPNSGSNVIDVYGTVLSAQAEAVDLAGRNNQVFVATSGVVSGGRNGLLFADGGNSVLNHGQITAKGTAWAIHTGDDSRIVNAGTIDAAAGSGIQATGGWNTILNSGEVTTRFTGLRVDNGFNQITNDGDIVSLSTIGASYGVVFSSEAWQIGDRLSNSGLIAANDAAVLGGTGSETVANTGRVQGHVLLNAGDDVVVNAGSITGDVILDVGSDQYDGRLGVVDGLVDGGAGDDILFGGRVEDTLRGGDGVDRLRGNGGADVLAGGTGNDRLHGGVGADMFLFESGSGRDVIVDFTDQVDKLEVQVTGVDAFEDLTLRGNVHGDAVVVWRDGTATGAVTLVGVNVDVLSAADFVF